VLLRWTCCCALKAEVRLILPDKSAAGVHELSEAHSLTGSQHGRQGGLIKQKGVYFLQRKKDLN
jgi:hypothetical protein